MSKTNAVFHVVSTGMVCTATALFPGSICFMFIFSLMGAAYGLGSRGATAEGAEPELPTLLVSYLAAGWLGAVVNCVALILLVRK